MTRTKTFDATGVAPGGRLFAGDLNAIQDAAAALADLLQNIQTGSVAVGESGLVLSRYGAGEARLSGSMRVDAIFRALGGFLPGTFTTTARDAISVGSRPYGLEIINTTTNRREWNAGTDAVPSWQPISSKLVTGFVNINGAILDGSGFSCVRNGLGDYTITFATPFASRPSVIVSVSDASVGATPIAVLVSGSIATTGFRVLTYNSTTGATRDQLFEFVAREIV